MNWITKAKNLPTNHKARHSCECGTGEPAIINHSLQGYSFYCFRCGEQEFEGKGTQTLEELAHIQELNNQANTDLPIELPSDFTNDIPPEGRLWLFKGGVTESQWRHYNFGWSDKMQRVVMPIYKDLKTKSQLIWFQARAVHKGQKPKYLNPSGDRTSLVFFTGTKTKEITVVEDILSAVRVGTTHHCCSMLGTKITTQQANILSQYDRVTTWLDPDKAGIDGAVSIRKAVGLITETRNITTLKDPKEYSNEEIIKTLQ